MSQAKKTIEYLDLSIPLLENQLPSIIQSIEDFEYHYDYIVKRPKTREAKLLINSNDIVPFLGFLNASNWSEIEIQRLKSNIRGELEGLLSKALHPDYRSHYQWCIAACENFEWGRFTKDQL